MKSRPSGHKLLHSVTVIAKSATDTQTHTHKKRTISITKQ